MKNNLTIYSAEYGIIILQDSEETLFYCKECGRVQFELYNGETIKCSGSNCGKHYRIKVIIDVLDDK
jgi:hypothetical protein